MELSSIYALFTSFRPALSADIYCPDGGRASPQLRLGDYGFEA
jgi:hypothetical protein